MLFKLIVNDKDKIKLWANGKTISITEKNGYTINEKRSVSCKFEHNTVTYV